MAHLAQEPQPEAEAVTQVRNQLKSQDLSTLEASSLATVGGRVYPDAQAIADLGALAHITEAWRAVHVPTYGAPIPGTGNVQSLTAEAPNSWQDVVVPTGQQVTAVQFAAVFNGDPGVAATVDVAIKDADGTAYVASSLNVPPSTLVNAFDLGTQPLTLDANVSLEWRVVTGVHSSVSIRTYTINLVG